MTKTEEILSTEYSEEFDQLRKNRMVMSFYKYGPMQTNYGEKLIDALGSMDLCITKYKKTGNTEYLVDAANYAMIEYMYPQHVNGHFEPTDHSGSAGIVGISINELKRFNKED